MAKGRVLIIDDEAIVRLGLTHLLRDEGYEVEAVGSGSAGVELATQGAFDAALVDLVLRGEDSMEVIHTLREMDEDLQILIITGYPTLETATQAVRLGAFDYLTKPMDNDRVLVSVRNALEARRLALRNRQFLRDLGRANEELERRVQERTAELAAANEALRQEMTERQRARQLSDALHAANLALTRSLELDAVLNTLLEYLGRLVPYDRGDIILLEPDSLRSLRILSSHQRKALPELQTNPILRALLQGQESIVIHDTRGYPGWVPPLTGWEGLRSWLGVPLVAGGRTIGLCSMGRAQPEGFTQEHQQAAEALALQAAVAIQNAQLFEQVRIGRQRFQALSRRLVEVQEAERRRVGLELHDEIGQLLTGLKLTLEMAACLPAEEMRASFSQAQALINELIVRVSDLSLDLRPSMLDDLGLLDALLWSFGRYTARTRVRVAFQHTGLEGRRFPPEIETAAYRIVQEALTNVARHAGVAEVAVRTWADQDVLGIQIEDRGRGFETEAALAGGTTGLAGMYERAALLGGYLAVESAPGAGTRLTAELPLSGHLERRHHERDNPAGR